MHLYRTLLCTCKSQVKAFTTIYSSPIQCRTINVVAVVYIAADKILDIRQNENVVRIFLTVQKS
jgi:hypothetical protein